MGTQSLVAVIGFLVTFGVVNSTMNTRNNLASDNTYGYVKYSAARDIARSAVQITLRKIDPLKVVRKADLTSKNRNLDGGRYDVEGDVFPANVVGDDDTIKLVSRAEFSDSTYVIRATLVRKDTLFPKWVMKSALGIYPSNPGFTAASQGGSISGNDHDLSGIPITTTPDTVGGITTRAINDAAKIKAVLETKNSSFTMEDVIGDPKLNVDPEIPNPNEFGDMFKVIADRVFTNTGKQQNEKDVKGNLGTASNPIIVFCEGGGKEDFHFQGEGWGILVVKGNLKMNASSTWRGLVIVYGNARVEFEAATGKSTVIGGVLVGGLSGSGYTIGGNSRILYSQSALKLANQAQKVGLYTVLDWYE